MNTNQQIDPAAFTLIAMLTVLALLLALVIGLQYFHAQSDTVADDMPSVSGTMAGLDSTLRNSGEGANPSSLTR